MKIKPSLDEFRNGGGETTSNQPSAMQTQVTSSSSIKHTPERTNKTIRIRKVFENKLKQAAYHRSIEEGYRVTESDIIDEALELYWNSQTQLT